MPQTLMISPPPAKSCPALLRFGVAAAIALVLALGFPRQARAQDSAETRAFKAASSAFDDKIFEKAEREFAQFVQTYPESILLPKAILLQAQAAFQLQKVKSAVDLLTAHSAKAGLLAEEYRYWLAKAHMQSSNYLAAAESFGLLTREFTNSVLLLEASHGEALARFKLKDWPRVITLLQQTNGVFQQAAKVRPNDELVARGHLLLAEALIEQKDYPGAEHTLNRLAERELVPENKWWRQYLLCRTQLANQRPNVALVNTTNLLALAAATGQPRFQAESVVMQGAILEQLNQLPAAVQAYEKNLAESVPTEYRRQALLKMIELTLPQNKIAEAARTLDDFVAKYPKDKALDVMLLTLGELHLKEHLLGLDTKRTNTAGIPRATNHLQYALAQFDKLILTLTNSPLLGKAHLNKGLGLWADGRIPEGQAAFQLAANLLPHSEDQAVAHFKLADAQFFQKDYSKAVQNYQMVITNYTDVPHVQLTLVDQALYQVLRASLELSDLTEAHEAMQRLLKEHPASLFRDRSMLLVAQGFTLADQPEKARALLMDLLKRIPDSPLRPDGELAIARTFAQQKDWASAIGQYDQWLARFPTNSLRPQGEFNRAWAHYQAGNETNALTLFTNIVAQFPTNELAARAQYWVARYFYDQKDYVNAEINFQDKLLLQNTNFVFQAQMMAGRAAVARRSFKDAEKYFTALVNNNTNPVELVEAFFALGDTFTLQAADPGKPTSKFTEAIKAFTKIPQLYPASPLVPRAWGRIGDCFLQLGDYDKSRDFYKKVLAPESKADVGARSQAAMGLGHILEMLAQRKPASEAPAPALLKSALEYYYDIVSGKNLGDGEKSDPFWFKEAGFAAARLAEELKQWDVALSIYKRLVETLPVLGPALEKKIEKAREKLRPEKD